MAGDMKFYLRVVKEHPGVLPHPPRHFGDAAASRPRLCSTPQARPDAPAALESFTSPSPTCPRRCLG